VASETHPEERQKVLENHPYLFDSAANVKYGSFEVGEKQANARTP
jgi:hypothetical protein